MNKIRRTHRIIALALVVLLVGVLGARYWAPIAVQLGHLYYGIKSGSVFVPKTAVSRIETRSFFSTQLQTERQFRVYLPPGYDARSKKTYPTLYLLHGFPGSMDDWLINANLQQQLDRFLTEKILPPLIVVFPDGNGPIVADSQYVDATAVRQPMESFLLEIVAETDRQYRTINDRRARAIGGLSSGAFGALNIGIRHNEVFAFILSHSGYGRLQKENAKDLFGANAEAKKANSPLDELPLFKPQTPTFISLDIGESDSQRFLQENVQLDTLLSQRGIPHVFSETPGGHTWGVWTNNIGTSLRSFGSFLAENGYATSG